jgi:SAM-dependent methyltransferase
MTTVPHDHVYALGQSALVMAHGEIGLVYRLPKYVRCLRQTFASAKGLSVLELGSGAGEVYTLLQQDWPQFVGDWTCSDISWHGARQEQQRGATRALQMDASRLSFPSNCFDLVVSLDVMHHVKDPQLMAQEILRVTRRYFFLAEANGLSPIRKLGEQNALARRFEERSYTPRQYRAFFGSNGLQNVRMWPSFVFAPPKTAHPLIPIVTAINERLEKVPGLRWMGTAVILTGEKTANWPNPSGVEL